jgi:2-keto-3-deoxy-L-rhamnonate aldolase RhmA
LPGRSIFRSRCDRYAPDGLRGLSGAGPHTDYESGQDIRSQLKFLNDQVHITVMFESKEAFMHIDEIVAMPGIDAVTLGPSDLAQELGVLGTPSQAAVIDEHRERLLDAARRHKKDVAMLVQTLDEAERWIKAGVKIIAYSSDVAVLRTGFLAASKRLK